MALCVVPAEVLMLNSERREKTSPVKFGTADLRTSLGNG
jgi:hypothetical protein